MKKYAYNEITVMQYIFLIHGTQVGIGVLTMPSDLAAIAGTDGWISIIIGWAMAVIVSLILVFAMKRYPDMTILDLISHFLGKWMGRAAAVLFALYCMLGAITVFAFAVSLINSWLLLQTPSCIIALLFIIPAYQVLHNGLRVLGRYSELIFYLTLWIPVALFTTFTKMHWIHLLPVFKEGWKPVLQASQSTLLSFLGFELAFFLYPFLQKKQYAPVGIVVANTLTMLVFMSVTIFCFAFFSPDEITQFVLPTLSLWKVIEFRFLERVDIIFLSFYMFIFSRTVMPYMFFTVFSTSQLLGRKDHRAHLKMFLLLILLAAFLYTPSVRDIKWMEVLMGRVGLMIAYAFPVMLGVVMLFMRKSTSEDQKV